MSSLNENYSWSKDRVNPSPMPLSYRAGLIVVAVMMVLLPLIYVGFCISVGFGLYLFATDETLLLGFHQPGIAAYFGVILAGIIGLVFMVKPLFTRKKRIKAHLPITQESQPELFDFIAQVCNRIGAPKPVRVLIDNQVNASASFDRGIWGFFTNRLVLTIGLPLAQGLTVSQFGGVLAHEFGHFTQSVAMRLNYVIRTINGWFNRVIYERDSMDANLKAWTKRGNVYWMLMANIAVCFIWVARKLLWLLMMSGHAVSAYMMRQMEYDADHYERQVTGPGNFKHTFLQMRLINAGAQMAGNHLNDSWKQGKLVDNYPLLVSHMTASISQEHVQSFSNTFETDKSVAKWHSTHPSDHQRIQRAGGDAENPALFGDQPAGVLFRDLAELAESVTRIDYTERFALEIKPETLVSTSSFVEKATEKSRRVREMSAFFGGLLSERRPIFPPTADEALEFGEPTAERLEQISRFIDENAKWFQESSAKIEGVRTLRAKAIAAQVLREMGVAIKPANFGLKDSKRDTITQAIEAYSSEITRMDVELAPYLKVAQEKLHLSCRLAEINAGAQLAELRKREDFLTSIQPFRAILQGELKSVFIASVYVQNYQAAKNKKQAEAKFAELGQRFKQATGAVESAANSISYPLQDGNTYPHLAAYFVTGNSQPGPMGQYHYMNSMMQRYQSIYSEVMLELLDLIPKPVEPAIVA